ncbi:hypothetical protein MPC4_140069 [Methylocella tundrae]|uniref:Uncharacterized protein n=1 Tax=Methylocella tundrae TaxID=227605 RepID=A0A8B6M4D8_METTU|nr:hypothetical protein MPC1_1080010 [Methylocella tundrae]VTZ49170.1 hypothetical protein MPC4_140069 [Methylocella tundrae]
MTFWIELLKGRDIIESEQFRGDAAAVRSRAVDLFAIHKKQLDATSVRVIDSAGGKIVFSLPDRMSPTVTRSELKAARSTSDFASQSRRN